MDNPFQPFIDLFTPKRKPKTKMTRLAVPRFGGGLLIEKKVQRKGSGFIEYGGPDDPERVRESYFTYAYVPYRKKGGRR